MSGNIKFNWFLIAFLLVTLFCSSCAWIKSNGQWSFKKKYLKSEILKNPNNYGANYDLGVAYLKRGESFSKYLQIKKYHHYKEICLNQHVKR